MAIKLGKLLKNIIFNPLRPCDKECSKNDSRSSSASEKYKMIILRKRENEDHDEMVRKGREWHDEALRR